MLTSPFLSITPPQKHFPHFFPSCFFSVVIPHVILITEALFSPLFFCNLHGMMFDHTGALCEHTNVYLYMAISHVMSQRALTDLQQQSLLTQAKLSKKFKKTKKNPTSVQTGKHGRNHRRGNSKRDPPPLQQVVGWKLDKMNRQL